MTIIAEPDPGFDYHLTHADGGWNAVELDPAKTYVLVPERGAGHQLREARIGTSSYASHRIWLEYVDRRTTERGPAC